MATIEISQGKQAIIDDEDYPEISKYRWNYQQSQYGGYACTFLPKVNGKRQYINMHRLLTNAPKGLEVDHINGNKLDNRKSNLRVVTRGVNTQNRPPKKTYSGFRGVACENKKYRAYICFNNIRTDLGLYSTSVEAAQAYNKAALTIYGRDAWVNKLPTD